MSRTLLALIGSLVTLVVAVVLLSSDGKRSERSKSPLTLFCAASNRAVIEAIRGDYEKEFGRQVHIQYGPSQTLLSSLEVSEIGDLYLPADDSFIAMAREKDLLAEVLPLAEMRAVVAVKRGNPKSIHKFSDLLRDDVTTVQANPDATAIGKVTRQVLTESGLWETLQQHTAALRTTVNDVANDVVVDAADAGVVYDAVLHTYPNLEFIELPELNEVRSRVSVGVIRTCKQPSAALHFARYLAASDRGAKRYTEYGFRSDASETWSDVPEISIFAGSMLKPAIDDLITEFETREGVRVTRVYNGCGILVAQMKAGLLPDAYFACDKEFMNQVTDLFAPPVDVSQNELVILVQKGNPHSIRSLKDLTRKGLRVGIGHEKQCAMGWITQNTFREGGVQQEVMENVTVQTPTGDMLVNQLRTGSLDAAVAYLSNAAGAADYLDAIQIQGITCSVATQPWAVAAGSKFPQTAGRLFDKLSSTEAQEVFESEGFRWQIASPP
jgi:molybdate transport system substrate-binding protein